LIELNDPRAGCHAQLSCPLIPMSCRAFGCYIARFVGHKLAPALSVLAADWNGRNRLRGTSVV